MVFFTGCVVTHGPKPQDTEFDNSRRNWVKVYENEIRIAIDNKDYESYYFFVQELIKDKYREQYDKEMDPNPSLKFLK